MTTSEQVLELLNSNDMETKPVEGADRCHLFSVGVVGQEDIDINMLFVENDDNDILLSWLISL